MPRSQPQPVQVIMDAKECLDVLHVHTLVIAEAATDRSVPDAGAYGGVGRYRAAISTGSLGPGL